MLGRKVSDKDDGEVQQIRMIMMLAVPNEVAGNVPELEGDAFLAKHLLHHHQMLSNQVMEKF